MRTQILTTLVCGLLCLNAWAQQSEQDNSEVARGLTVAHAKRHLTFLADDKLRGRLTGTEGCRKAADYLAKAFAAVGAKPGMGDSYFQPWALSEQVKVARLRATFGERTMELEDLRPLWFSGEGKVSGKLHYLRSGSKADIAGLEFQGALVLVEAGAQATLVQRLQRVAAGKPAAIILIGTGLSRAMTSSEANTKRFWGGLLKFGGRVLTSLLPGGSKIGGLDLSVLIGRMQPRKPGMSATQRKNFAAIPLLIATRRALTRALGKNVTPRDRTGSLELEGAIELKLEFRRKMTRNVVAVVRGSDPELRNEVIVLGAHYDHIGARRHSKRRDGIYNGADDNASGTTGLLLLAEALVKKPARRTVVLVAFSGEEYGLLGSRYYASNPRPGKMVAMLNFDMIGRLTDRKLDIGGLTSSPAFKAVHEQLIKQRKFTVRLTDAMLDRSDQAEFLKKGVPALFFFTGEHAQYHEPADHADKINYKGLLDILRLGLSWTRTLGDADKAPGYDKAFRSKLRD